MTYVDTISPELADNALTLLRERGDQVLNAIDDGVYCLDDEGRAIFVNEAAARMMYTRRGSSSAGRSMK